MKFHKGKACPKCNKGTLEKAKCCGKPAHKGNVICKTCGFTNF